MIFGEIPKLSTYNQQTFYFSLPELFFFFLIKKVLLLAKAPLYKCTLINSLLQDSRNFGWKVEEKLQHDWSTMVAGIQNHIGSLNWGYKVALRDKKVDYLNSFASFVDPHTIKVTFISLFL